jgi:glycosyltransferase involved in cell wall biosynthesis
MKISVILPNYNHGAFLSQSIGGVLSQTHQDLELIVIDDGSTDGSVEVIERARQNDTRIKPLLFRENRGANAAVLDGLHLAGGTLLLGIGADDYLIDRTFFASAVELMRCRPEAAGVFARTLILDKIDDHLLWTTGTAPKEGYLDGQEFLDAFLANAAFVPGASAILRLDLVKQAGGLQIDLGPQSDYFINHALPAAHGVFFINRDVAAYRASPTSYSAAATDADYFRCHALMELKLRAYASDRYFNPVQVHTWRNNTVKSRLSVWHQEALFGAVKAIAQDLQPWEKRAMPPEIVSLAERYLGELTPIKAGLDNRTAAALAIFEEIAGPLREQQELPTATVSSGGFWKYVRKRILT